MPDRSRYAADQAALLDSLMRGDRYPPGFSGAQGDAAGRSLRRKRARAVRREWPALVHSLGPEFDGRFDAFARTNGPPTRVDGLADGLAFAASFERNDPAINEHVLVEKLLARSVVRRRGGRSVRRRGFFVGAQRLAATGTLLIVARAPWLGQRHISISLGRRLD